MSVFIQPGSNDGSTSATSMLLDMYVTGINTPTQVDAIFSSPGAVPGVTVVPAEPGGSYRHIYAATAPAPIEVEKGDIINGQVLGQVYQTITREDVDMAQAMKIHESDYRRVEWTARRVAQNAAQHRYNIGALRSRRVIRAAALAARGASSETVTAGGVTMFAYDSGTRITRTGGTSGTVNDAVSAAYDYNDSTRRVKAFEDLRELRYSLDSKNQPTGPGARNAVLDYEFWTAVHTYALIDKSFESTNVILEGGGELPRTAKYYPLFDLTVIGVMNRYSGSDYTLPTNGNYGAGMLPSGNVTDGPSVLRANFIPSSANSGNGFPVLVGMIGGSEKGAVHYTEEKPLTPIYHKEPLEQSETLAVVAMDTIAPLCPEKAFSIEVIYGAL